jgi:predicted RND superfamily exporter protein
MQQRSGLFEKFSLRLANFVVERRWLVMITSLLIVMTAGSGLRFLEVSNNYRVFFSADNPDLIAFDNFQATYTKNDNILFVLKPGEGGVFTNNTLDAVERLTDAAWQIPYAIRVDSVTNFQHSWARRDDLIVEDLVRNAPALGKDDLLQREAVALSEPLLNGSLLAVDGSATGVNVTLQYPEQALSEVPEAMDYAHKLADEIQTDYPQLTVAVSGVSALNAAFAEATITDGITLFPIMFFILTLATWFILKSASSTFATVMVISFATLAALGFAGFAGITFSPFSGTAPVVILTLAVADSIHILIGMFTAMREGKDRRSALKDSVKVNTLAVTITSVTTIIGFLALNFSDAPPFRDLGNIAAVGIAAAWFLSLTFLPAMMSLLPVKAVTRSSLGRVQNSIDRLAGFVIRRYRQILFSMTTITLLLSAAIPGIDLNDEWVKYFDHRVSFRGDAEFAQDNLTGLYPIEYSIGAGAPEGVSDPAYLNRLEAFTEWLKHQPEVVHVYSYADIIKRLNKNMHGDDPAWQQIPQDRRLAAQYLLLYELSLPYGLDLSDRVSVDKSSTRVTATLGDLPTRQTRDFIERSTLWLQRNTPEHMWAQPTGAPVMFSRISERNIKDMTGGNAVALVLIALVMMLALRSFSTGALSLLPNAIPILMTFGIWALLVGQVGMAAATVSATSLGIIVDSSVHFLAKYVRARREHGFDKPKSVRYAFRTVGLAIAANTAILAAGFSVLAYSSFAITAEMGVLTAMAIVVALVVDFLLLPSLLLFGHKQSQEDFYEYLAKTEAV